MENVVAKLKLLKKQGESFTYENFSTKSHFGYPDALSTEWTTWTTRVSSIISKLFEKDSPQCKLINNINQIHVIGNDTDKFDQCKNGFISTLDIAIDTIENDLFNEISRRSAEGPDLTSNKVFIVHGHDDSAKTSLEIFLGEIGLKPIVLHRQADEGLTIIEKFEKHSDVGYAFILLTPDEIAYLTKYEGTPQAESAKEKRARPNVIFEFGFFVGRLGRSRVCCLHTGNVTLPTDLSGVVYKSYNNSIEEVAYPIIKDLKACGYKLKD